MREEHETEDTLTLQVQPTDTTCVHTCLAIILGVPVQEVIEHYGESPITAERLCSILTECNILWNQLVFGTLAHEGWYLAAVPSLNHKAMMHQVLLWSALGEGMHVLDPARGKTYAADGSDLTCWESLILVHPGGRLPRRGAQWCSIDTAPKNGSAFLGWGPTCNCQVVWWEHHGFISEASDECGMYEQPTHWMPLPEPPTQPTS